MFTIKLFQGYNLVRIYNTNDPGLVMELDEIASNAQMWIDAVFS